jgi:hypothetical protein
MAKSYYTYAHTKPDGTIFYIGKGTGYRANQKCGRNPHWKNVTNKYGFEVKMLADNIDEELALLCEIEAIDVFKRRGYDLVNKTSGGDNPIWTIVTDETRAKMSKSQTGKKMSVDTKNKIRDSKWGERNPTFKGSILATNVKTGKQKTYIGNKSLEADGFDNTNVYRCINGKRKTHKGHTFSRLGEYHS